MVTINKDSKTGLKTGLMLAKIYYIVSILKFPLVMSKNGIINGTLAILFIGGICSTIGNYMVDAVLRRTGEKTYIGASEKSMGKMHALTQVCMFIFRCIALFYMIDLSHRLMRSMGTETFVDPRYVSVLLWVLLMLVTYLLPDPNLLISGLTRNTVTIALSLLLTVIFSISNASSNIKEINFTNPAESFFSSYALTFICFAQQIATAPILMLEHDTNHIQIILSGILSSLGYIAVGALGYLSCQNPNLNWCFNIDNTVLRIISSFVFLTMNILQYPVVFNPVCDDALSICRLQKNSKGKAILSFILTVLFMPASLLAVSSKHLQFPCLIFSALIMIILPCLFYIKAKEKSSGKNVLAVTNLGIGSFFIGKACVDWLQVE